MLVSTLDASLTATPIATTAVTTDFPALSWSAYQQVSFDRSLMASQPLVDGAQVGLMAVRVRAETKRQAAAIHSHSLLERYGKGNPSAIAVKQRSLCLV